MVAFHFRLNVDVLYYVYVIRRWSGLSHFRINYCKSKACVIRPPLSLKKNGRNSRVVSFEISQFKYRAQIGIWPVNNWS